MRYESGVGVAVLTYNGRDHLGFCLPPLLDSPLRPKVLVIDSSSQDGTKELACEMGAEVFSISRGSFNHGLTRELARRKLGTEVVVMVTQDAYAESEETLKRLVEPLMEGRASLAYARQLPKEGADVLESFSRKFNYPEEGHIRSLQDRDFFKSYLYFFSDSFGAYLNGALDEIGGFSKVLLGEDQIACARLIHRGHRVAYQAEARVFHSHRYGVREEFRRHFDIGLSRKEYSFLLHASGRDEKRGWVFAKECLLALLRGSWLDVPRGCLHLVAKYAGYQLGFRAEYWPVFLKKKLSSQTYYWDFKN